MFSKSCVWVGVYLFQYFKDKLFFKKIFKKFFFRLLPERKWENYILPKQWRPDWRCNSIAEDSRHLCNTLIKNSKGWSGRCQVVSWNDRYLLWVEGVNSNKTMDIRKFFPHLLDYVHAFDRRGLLIHVLSSKSITLVNMCM